MTMEELKKRKKELGLTTEMLAQLSGVPVGTLQKVFSGATKAPRKATIDAIRHALLKAEEGSSPGSTRLNQPVSCPAAAFPTPGMVCEPGWYDTAARSDETAKPIKIQNLPEKQNVGDDPDRKYTLEDYYALPEDRRVELIDGKFYDMTSPSDRHQSILGDLHILFRECIASHDMPCNVTFAPYDVWLDKDNYTMVQPDLVVSCHDDGSDHRRYEGAPDLLVEVLSPSTRSKDMLLKLYKYHNAGVREYWIVDPKRQSVTVHYFEEEEYEPKKYDFDSEIPINISGGECSIDFSRVGRMPGARWRR